MLHKRLPIFWKYSPVDFLHNLTPKIFFDALSILATQAYDQSEATVALDGRLYTFPKSFTALKDILLSAVNRAILRMHSLNATDAALLIAMGSFNFAYKKIQKHRTGRTLTMQLFLKEVYHIMEALKSHADEMVTLYPECNFFAYWKEEAEEDAIKCALFRFMKIGSLQVEDNIKVRWLPHKPPRAQFGWWFSSSILNELPSSWFIDSRASAFGIVRLLVQQEVETYVSAFVEKLAELKGRSSWKDYLNLDYFLTSAEVYGNTAARYKYEILYNQINDIPGSDKERSDLQNLMQELHPSLLGYKPVKPQKKQGQLSMLKRLNENLNLLPGSIKRKVAQFCKQTIARLRRLVGSRRSWFYTWR